MKKITTLGIDLAKHVFQLHGVDERGRCVLRKRLTRDKVSLFLSKIAPCVIGIEACSGAHYWAREWNKLGHSVKIMSPQFVKPYVKGHKNDVNDAAGITEAVSRPDMKFVPHKTVTQQDMLLVHRARELVVKQRTAQVNQIRGLLAEYGIVINKHVYHVNKLMSILDEHRDHLSEAAYALFEQLYLQFKHLSERLAYYTDQIKHWVSTDAQCQSLLAIEGIGPISASAAVGTLGDANTFKCGRSVAAFLGLVPKQHSSGGRHRLLGITKRGDSYLRKLLIHGARSVVRTCDTKTDPRSVWLKDKKQRCGANKAAVALANKNARIIGAILSTGECYRKAA